jgi:hypothetical protein
LSAAAALLLAIGLPYGLYRHGLAQHETALRQVNESLDDLAAQAEELHERARLEAKSLAVATRARHLHLEVIGPADYQPGVPCEYQVRTSNLNGAASPARVGARLVDGDRKILAKAPDALSSEGDLLVSLTPTGLLPRGQVHLQILVSGSQELQLQQALRLSKEKYVTHLALNQDAYRPGESIYFRSLTLESYGLRPPHRPMPIAFTLADAQGKTVYESKKETGLGGISGGQYRLPPDQPEGEYTLSVVDPDRRFPAIARRILVRRDGAGTRSPADTSTWQVEFFPEGGDLVAGVPRRVYFRARNPQGEPAQIKGTLVDGQGRRVVAVQSADTEANEAHSRGLGVFTFTPEAGENYRLKIDLSREMGAIAELPPVMETGLALSVPASVLRPGEPVRARLHQVGAERQVLLALFCRGYLVAQQTTLLKEGQRGVEIVPPTGCQGVLRLAVFDSRQGLLEPIAERLVYRAPTDKLNLALDNLKARYAPGGQVQLTIRSTDQKGTPLGAWLSVSVVDASVEETRLPGLVSHFFLADGNQPVDEMDAGLPLNAVFESDQALDLFLGTQRLHLRAAGDSKAALAVNRQGNLDDGKEKAPLAVVRLDNFEQAKRDADAALTAAMADLGRTVAAGEQKLAKEGERLQGEVHRAAQALNTYQARVAENVRLAVGIGLVGVLATGCILLIVGLVRLVRGHLANTPYLAGAFAALLLCVLTLLTPANPWHDSGPPSAAIPFARAWPKALEERDLYAAIPPLRDQGSSMQQRPGATPFAGPMLVYREVNVSTTSVLQPIPEGPPNTGQGKVATFRAPGKQWQKGPPEYINAHPGSVVPRTLVWRPALFAEGGTAQVMFALPEKTGKYRIRIEASGDGMLSAMEAIVESGPEGAGTER